MSSGPGATIPDGLIGSNDYFRCRWFKNGNMHIEFLRADLLAEFNKIVHGATLREPAA